MILVAIEKLLSQKIGIDAQIIGNRKIAIAVEMRRLACGLPDLEAYFKLLQTLPQEFEELVEQIVVPETYFFRDRKPFNFLKDYVRSEWLAKSNRTKFSLLSVPCSTGEEPYSMAITLLEAGLPAHRFSIDAIDISKQAISKAKTAIYGKNSFRGEDWIDRDRYFQLTKTGYEVIAPVRNRVNFRIGNLLNIFSKIQGKYDIIFCRNLLIYLELTACAEVFQILDRLLVPNGLLFVGASETAKVPSDRFTSIRQSYTFAYQKASFKESSPSLKKTSAITEIDEFPSKLIEQRYAVINSNSSTSVIRQSSTIKPASKPIQSKNQGNNHSSFEIAKQLADAGEIEAAINHCKQYLESNLGNVELYTLLGTLYQTKAENNQAEQYFRKALYVNPNYYEALIQLALLKEHRGDLVGANILWQRIQKLEGTGN
ncbi:MAG: CheR family methyltransferase [Phormidium sp.]